MFIIIEEDADPAKWVFHLHPQPLRPLRRRISQEVHGESICFALPIAKQAGEITLAGAGEGGEEPEHEKPAAQDPGDREDSQIDRQEGEEDQYVRRRSQRSRALLRQKASRQPVYQGNHCTDWASPAGLAHQQNRSALTRR